jgi:hypothetical protein
MLAEAVADVENGAERLRIATSLCPLGIFRLNAKSGLFKMRSAVARTCETKKQDLQTCEFSISRFSLFSGSLDIHSQSSQRRLHVESYDFFKRYGFFLNGIDAP